MSPRALAILLGIALAVSVGVNLFAATAAITALSGQQRIEREIRDRPSSGRRPSTREVIAALSPEARAPVRRALREAGVRARSDFQQARTLRREAVDAAGADPLDRERVATLLARSREAEARARAGLEADALAILETLEPSDRRVVAQLLTSRGRGDRRDGRGPRAEQATAD